MRRIGIAHVVALCALMLGSGVGTASAAPADREITLTAQQRAFEWQGTAATASNLNYFYLSQTATAVAPVGTCSKDRHTYCETIHVTFENPYQPHDFDVQPTRSVTARVFLDRYEPVAASDFDLVIHQMGAGGVRGSQVGSSAQPDGAPESVAFRVRFTRETVSVSYVVDVVYWLVAESRYHGRVTY